MSSRGAKGLRREAGPLPALSPVAVDTTSGGQYPASTGMATAAQLTRLGLTSYEAKAYLALLRRESSTAAQAARLANVPRQRIYPALPSLVDKGLATTRPGQVVKY